MFRPVFEQVAKSDELKGVDFCIVNCTSAPREMSPAIKANKSAEVSLPPYRRDVEHISLARYRLLGYSLVAICLPYHPASNH